MFYFGKVTEIVRIRIVREQFIKKSKEFVIFFLSLKRRFISPGQGKRTKHEEYYSLCLIKQTKSSTNNFIHLAWSRKQITRELLKVLQCLRSLIGSFLGDILSSSSDTNPSRFKLKTFTTIHPVPD